jgi:adenylylsulfate kinase-like enzyme
MSLSYNFTLISRKFSSLKMSKGKFIVMEGLDRSGKSTMTKHIQNKLSENNAT